MKGEFDHTQLHLDWSGSFQRDGKAFRRWCERVFLWNICSDKASGPLCADIRRPHSNDDGGIWSMFDHSFDPWGLENTAHIPTMVLFDLIRYIPSRRPRTTRYPSTCAAESQSGWVEGLRLDGKERNVNALWKLGKGSSPQRQMDEKNGRGKRKGN